MKRSWILGCALSVVCLAATSANAQVTFVRTGGSDANDGSTWANAKQTLQAAINATPGGGEVWAGQGTYNENRSANPDGFGSLEMKADVAVYGGFDGTETARGQRDWEANVTTIDGGPSSAKTVVGVEVDGSTLDGFTITGGNASDGDGSGSSTFEEGGRGGGVYIGGGNALRRAFTLRNCRIENNTARIAGGGMTIQNVNNTYDGDPILIENCVFIGNGDGNLPTSTFEGLGGGLNMLRTDAIVRNCQFYGNVALYGGAIYAVWTEQDNEDNADTDDGELIPQVENCLFVNNTADNVGGGIYSRNADITITHCTFYSNTSSTVGPHYTTTDGGALAGSNGVMLPGGNSGEPANPGDKTNVWNCIFIGNSGGNNGILSSHVSGAPFNPGWTLQGATVTSGGGGNFVAASTDINTANFDLAVSSAAIDAVTGGNRKLATDIRGVLRGLFGATGAAGTSDDAGAYERDPGAPSCAPAANYNINLSTDDGTAVVAGDINNGSSDPGGIASVSISGGFTASCATLGPHTVTLTVEDNAGNQSTCQTDVTVVDDVPPILVTQDVTLQLDAGGSLTIVQGDVVASMTDNCSVTLDSISPNTFSCSEAGTVQSVTVTIVDGSGNAVNDTADVTIQDAIVPTAPLTGTNISVQLDGTDNYSLGTGDIAALITGAADNCGIDLAATLATATQSAFTAGDGCTTVSVTVTVTDDSGNVAANTTTADVEVIENVALSFTNPADQLDVLTGATASFSITSVQADCGNVTYQWEVSTNGGGSFAPSALPTANAATLEVTSVSAAEDGNLYRCVVSDFDETVTSGNALLTHDASIGITQHPMSDEIYTGTTKTLTVAAVGGTGFYSYFWRLGANPAPGVNNLITYDIAGGGPVAESNSGSYTCTILELASAGGSPTGNIATSNPAVILVRDRISITTGPVGGSAYDGGDFTFTVAADGGFSPLSYQWFKDANGDSLPTPGEEILGADSASYTIDPLDGNATTDLDDGSAGRYLVTINDANTDDETSGVAILQVAQQVTISAPVPASLALYTDSPAENVSVTATGGFPGLTYAWYIDIGPAGPIAITGATSDTLVFDPSIPESTTGTGTIYVAVTDPVSNNTENSTGVAVEIADHLAFTLPLLDETAQLGSAFTWDVITSGGLGTVGYQWFKDDGTKIFQPLAGETGPSFTIDPVDVTDEGLYQVVVNDDVSDVIMSQANLTVNIITVPAMSLFALMLATMMTALGGVLVLQRQRRHGNH